MWKLTIERVENGFVLEGDFKQDGGSYHMVFEEYDNEFGEIEAMQKVLFEVIEYFGLVGSKHDKKRIKVVIDEQDT